MYIIVIYNIMESECKTRRVKGVITASGAIITEDTAIPFPLKIELGGSGWVDMRVRLSSAPGINYTEIEEINRIYHFSGSALLSAESIPLKVGGRIEFAIGIPNQVVMPSSGTRTGASHLHGDVVKGTTDWAAGFLDDCLRGYDRICYAIPNAADIESALQWASFQKCEHALNRLRRFISRVPDNERRVFDAVVSKHGAAAGGL